MKLLEKELKYLRQSLVEMTMMVISQFEKSIEAFEKNDKTLALEVTVNERRINAYELRMDAECENIFALHHPVAADLRLVMAGYNITATLERIADNADAIAKYVLEMDSQLNSEILKVTKFGEMSSTALRMLNDALDAFEELSPGKVYSIHNQDIILNEINIQASNIMVSLIKQYPDDVRNLLFLFSTIKKVERVGDLVKNIAEEIIFYFDAKTIKHTYPDSSAVINDL
ncbi:MAG: phosphate signaling complex protein PhoU [Marinilabiliaceae bacterium]|nr:phosphate signaling complex protein PhoU [Marinilabiliaceae bacterium]